MTKKEAILRAEDMRDFYEKGDAYSRASDHLYDYEMWRTDETVEISKEEAFHEFRKLEKSATFLSPLIEANLDVDYECYNAVCKELSHRYKFGYRRVRKDGKT